MLLQGGKNGTWEFHTGTMNMFTNLMIENYFPRISVMKISDFVNMCLFPQKTPTMDGIPSDF